ncbi:ribokinase [Rhodococcus chondri]|uniref:Ribokinase n=1 Tax=Rhodococcus chondri TaxID=3065941 RepID=A0ABU7JRM0_9NOCA|nr:ribokinase [Rhodococcus sp. CC-R104]MEE2032686.1 ribokinase [Rhodococcus sp. CC-R104]
MGDAQDCSVAVVGSLNLDLTAEVARAPEEGETVLGRRISTHPGGKGANQAIGAARLARTAIVGAVGNDHAADVVRDAQRAGGVDTRFLYTANVPTGRAIVVVSRDGQNRIIVVPQANSMLDVQQVTAALDELDPSVVLTQLELPAAVTRAAAAWATEHHRRFVLNPSPVAPVDDLILGAADPLVVNELEAAYYAEAANCGGAPDTEIESVVARLLELATTVVVTRGGDDVVVGTQDAVEYIPVPHVTVADTTGAGDHFAGTLAALLGAGEDLFTAARRAASDAAEFVSKPRSER